MMMRLPLLLCLFAAAPAAHAFDIHGLHTGDSREQAAKVLSPVFPQAGELKSSIPRPSKFVNVVAYDAAACAQTPSCFAAFYERPLDAAPQGARKVSVEVKFTDQGRVSNIMYLQQSVTVDACPLAAEALIKSDVEKYGPPEQRTLGRRNAAEYQYLQWGDCGSLGQCYMLSVGCTDKGVLDAEATLSYWTLAKQDSGGR